MSLYYWYNTEWFINFNPYNSIFKYMFTKQALKKYAFRFLVVNIIYFLVKLTIDYEGELLKFNSTSVFYYISAFFLIFFTWGINDWFIEKYAFKLGQPSLNYTLGTKIVLLSLLVCIPVAALVYYLGIFVIKIPCGTIPEKPLWLRFRIDFLRACLLGITVVVSNLLYQVFKQKEATEYKLLQLQQELATSKFKSLKDQISPHFLFNSLNTLTSLMYEDRDMASDFVSRLASCYRYILDQNENDLVELQKEMQFMDAFIFMMNVRHREALQINTDIEEAKKQHKIPVLALQMLVENALKHNYYSLEKPLVIQIQTKDNVLEVRNTLNKRLKEDNTTGVGLDNIRKRYAFYTERFVEVSETAETFSVSLPLLVS